MSTSFYDMRRFRTLTDIVIPAGTLVLPTKDGYRAACTSPDTPEVTATFDIAEAIVAGTLKQLGTGQS